MHYYNIFLNSALQYSQNFSTHPEVRARLKEVIKWLETDLNKQEELLMRQVVISIYLLVCNNVMHLQLLIFTLWIIVEQIICGQNWRIWSLAN